MIQPVAKWIAIKKIVEEKIASSGLVMSAKDTAETRYKKAEVLAVGDEVTNLKKGDIILYDDNGSYTMLIEAEWVTIIQYREVVANL